MENFKVKITGLLFLICLLLVGIYAYQFSFSTISSGKLQAGWIKKTPLPITATVQKARLALQPKTPTAIIKTNRAIFKQKKYAAISHQPPSNTKAIEMEDAEKEEAAREAKEQAENKPDRPDLALEQDFLRTMDPALNRPTPEVLTNIIKRNHPPSASDAKAPRMPGDNTSAATNWKELGPDNVGGRTRALTWDPNTPNKVWAGGVGGGLWYNNDITSATSSWVRVDDFWATLSVTKIVFDPSNSQIAYVSTGEGFGVGKSIGAGIWKTTNGGGSWSQISSTANFNYINDMAVRNETGPWGALGASVTVSVIYAAVDVIPYEGDYLQIFYSGLQRSIDGGANWTQVLPPCGNGHPYVPASISLNASRSRIWVGTKRSNWGNPDPGGGRVLYSDNGTSWTVANTLADASGGRVTVACAPSDDNYVYSFMENTKADGTTGIGGLIVIRKSINKGGVWTDVAKPADADNGIDDLDFTRGQAWYDQALAIDPTNAETLLIGGIDLFRSTNAGTSWTQISKWSNNPGLDLLNCSYVHADQHAISFKPGSSTEVIFGNDGGVFYSPDLTNAATTDAIANRNKNYNVTQFYSAAIHPTIGNNTHLAGAQDNGTQKFNTDGMNSTVDKIGGDGAYCFIDQNNPDFQIASYVYNNFYLSTNGGSSFSDLLSDDATGSFINPACYDNNQHVLYSFKSVANGESIYRIKNITTTPVTSTIALTNLTAAATAFKVSPFTTSSTTLFIGTADGKLIKLTNANNTPVETDITGTWPRPDGAVPSISCIELGRNENEILVTFFNYGVVKIWYSSDGGITWASKMGDFPNMPVRWALFNPNHPTKEVILATELGIYGTANFDNNNPNWTAKNTGFANVRTDMLQMRSSDYMVIAATHGRGLFSSMGFSEAAAPTISAFTPASAGSGTTVTITGTNLTGATAVSFGGTPASSFTVVNSTSITAVVNAGNCGSVSVTTPGGVATKNEFNFIMSIPLASVTLQPTCTVATGTITVSSPTTGLIFSIDGTDYSNTNGIFTTIASGTYSLTARNASGCTSPSTSLTVAIQPTPPPIPTTSLIQPTCVVASGTISVSSSTAGLTFSINGTDYSNSTGIFTAIATGNYNLTARNTGGCTSPATSVTITSQPAIPATPAASVTAQPTCALPTGTITVSSPTAGLTFSIDGVNYSNSSGILTAVIPGTYTLTARNTSGCASAAVAVTVNAAPATPTTPSFVTTQPTCTVASGTISVSSSTAGFTFSIDGVNYSNTTGIFTAIASGNYNLTARNTSGCISVSNSVTVNSPPTNPAAPTTSATNQPTCTVATGSIAVSSSTTGFTFSIDGINYMNTTGIFTPVAIGTYSLTARNASGCTSAATSVTINAQPVTPAAPTVSVSTQPTCTVATGTITISSSIAYLAFSLDGTTYTNTNGIFTSIATGTYSLTARNSSGCTSTATSITVNVQPASPAAPIASVTAQPSCAVATGTITVSSPTAGLTFSIDAVNYSNSTGVFNNIAPGIYTLTAKNTSGCTIATTSMTVNEPPANPTAPIASVSAQPTCTVNNGTIAVSSPTAGFTFSIDGITYANSNGIFTNVAPGTYNLTKRNTSGCTSTATILTVAAQPSTPTAPTASVTAQPTCDLPTGTITVSSVTANLTFSTNGTSYSNANGILSNINPGTYNLTARNSSGCTSAATSITVNPPPASPSAPVAMVAIQPTCIAPKGTIMVNSLLAGLHFSLDGIDFSNSTGIFTNVAPGNYIVTAKNTAGCTSNATSITVSAPPVNPVANAASVTAQPTCAVATGTITISSPVIGLTFSIDGNDYSNTNGIFINVASGNYSLTSRNSIGCISAATILTVAEQPTIANNTITLRSAVATNAQTPCINSSITNISYATSGVTGASFSGLPIGVSGIWSANIATISGTTTVAGTFNYTVLLTGGCGNTTATGSITTIPNNTVTLSSSAGSDNQTNCTNTLITPITYSTMGATGATFSGLPAGVSGVWAANIATISGTPTVAGTYNYTVTLKGGCGNIAAAGTIIAKAIAISPSITAGSTSFCPGGSMLLTSSAATGNQWYKNGSPISGANAPTYAADAIGSYTVANFINGCNSFPSAAKIITASNIVSPPTITALGPTEFCNGATLKLASNVTTGIQWQLNGSVITGATNATYFATDAGNYTVLVTANGCTSAAITASHLLSPNKPMLSAATAKSFCVGENVTLISNETSGNFWYKDGVFITGATGSSYIASTSGSYTDTIVNSIGCKAGSMPAIIIVKAAPSKPLINWNGATLSTSSSASAFQWSVNNVPLFGATLSTYKPLTIGFYKIQITNSDGCTNISDSFNLVVTAINNPATTIITNLASVFPNPASPVLLVKFREAPNTTLEIRLITGDGRSIQLVKTKDKLTTIPINNVPSGKYYIRITGKNYNQTESVIISK
jgi:hypothetical protein